MNNTLWEEISRLHAKMQKEAAWPAKSDSFWDICGEPESGPKLEWNINQIFRTPT